MPDQLGVRITSTDRASEWSPDNPALLMPTQSVVDTPGATLGGRRFSVRITSTDRASEWSPDNPALLMPTQSSVPDTPESHERAGDDRAPDFRIAVTDRSDEWAPGSAAALMPSQCVPFDPSAEAAIETQRIAGAPAG